MARPGEGHDHAALHEPIHDPLAKIVVQLGFGQIADQDGGLDLAITGVEHIEQHRAALVLVADANADLIEDQQIRAGEGGERLQLGERTAGGVGRADGAQGFGHADEQAGMPLADDLQQDGTGQMGLAGAGSADQQQTVTLPAHALEVGRVAARDGQRRLLLGRGGGEGVEGARQETRRDARTAERGLKPTLADLAALARQRLDFGAADRFQVRQRGGLIRCPRSRAPNRGGLPGGWRRG